MPEGKIRLLREVIIRYKREPKLRDLWVEGNRDKMIYDYFFKQIGRKEINSYPIKSILIPKEKERKLGLKLGRNDRNKVIALAHELKKKSIKRFNSICVIDSDFDRILGLLKNWPNLVYTDFTSIEMYFFNEIVLDKFLSIVIGGLRCTTNKVLEELKVILPKFFLIRLTNIVLDLNLEWLDITRCCSCNESEIFFKIEDYIERYLNKNAKISYLNSFIEKYNELQTRLKTDNRHNIRGHDFIEMLSFLIKSIGNKEQKTIAKPHLIERSLFGCVELNFIENEPLFKILKQWSESTN